MHTEDSKWKASGTDGANRWTDKTKLGYWKWTPALTGLPVADRNNLWFALTQRAAMELISDSASTLSLRQELARPLIWEVFVELRTSGLVSGLMPPAMAGWRHS